MKILYLDNSVNARKKINYVPMSFFVLKVDNFYAIPVTFISKTFL